MNDILMQVIAMIGGQPDFSDLSFTINDAEFRYGAFLNTVIAFVSSARRSSSSSSSRSTR